MRKSIRFGLLALVSLAALAFAGSALATPSLLIVNPDGKLSGNGPTTVRYVQPDSDAPLAKLTIYVPLGYTGSLAHGIGDKIGKVTATIKATALGGAIVPVAGDVVNDDPTKYTAPPANACVPGLHEAVWLLNLSAAGQTLQVPVYADTIPAVSPESAFAAFKIQVCLPPPQTAQLGAQLLDATFSVTSTYVNPGTKGSFIWRGIVTPYTFGGVTPNAAGTVETQSIVTLPVSLTLAGKYDAKTRVVGVSGTLLEALNPIAGLPVRIFSGFSAKQVDVTGKASARVKTDALGTYKIARKIPKGFKGTLFARALVSRAARSTPCVGTLPTVPGGCVAANFAPYDALSALIRVRIK